MQPAFIDMINHIRSINESELSKKGVQKKGVQKSLYRVLEDGMRYLQTLSKSKKDTTSDDLLDQLTADPSLIQCVRESQRDASLSEKKLSDIYDLLQQRSVDKTAFTFMTLSSAILFIQQDQKRQDVNHFLEQYKQLLTERITARASNPGAVKHDRDLIERLSALQTQLMQQANPFQAVAVFQEACQDPANKKLFEHAPYEVEQQFESLMRELSTQVVSLPKSKKSPTTLAKAFRFFKEDTKQPAVGERPTHAPSPRKQH